MAAPAPRRAALPAAPPVRIALHDCKYPVLRNVARKLGWAPVEDEGAGDYFE